MPSSPLEIDSIAAYAEEDIEMKYAEDELDQTTELTVSTAVNYTHRACIPLLPPDPTACRLTVAS